MYACHFIVAGALEHRYEAIKALYTNTIGSN